jgi:hypothetical protein
VDDLIEALTILRKYTSEVFPTHCEHDVLYVCLPDPEAVSKKDVRRLEVLGFGKDEGGDGFRSYRFGSC